MGLRPTHRDQKLLPAVILSDEVAVATEESKDPYGFPKAGRSSLSLHSI
jgi:hypothetical protein